MRYTPLRKLLIPRPASILSRDNGSMFDGINTCAHSSANTLCSQGVGHDFSVCAMGNLNCLCHLFPTQFLRIKVT